MVKDSCLIIGGCGFIGSHLSNTLAKKGYPTIAFDNLLTGKREFLEKNANLAFEEGDMSETSDLDRVFEKYKPDTVFLLAGIDHVPTCERNPRKAFEINLTGLNNALKAIARHGSERVVFTSSGSIYEEKNGPLLEGDHLNPLDIYSISKVAGEHLMHRFHKQSGIPISIGRIFNVVGRHETNSHVIPDIMSQLAQGSYSIQLGNTFTKRDFVHVQDVAEALYALGKAPHLSLVDIMNIGSGTEHAISDLVLICADLVGQKVDVSTDPKRIRKIDRASKLASINKIKSSLGWEPKRNVHSAMKEMWEDFKDGYSIQPLVF